MGRGYVAITILDINDNAPEFAMDYETTVCENAQPGQVRRKKGRKERILRMYFITSPITGNSSSHHKDRFHHNE